MGTSAATIRDVARLAQVSITTASHALSGIGRVSAETRAKVAAAALELDYVPNASARSLRRARTDVIGLYLHPHATHLTFHHDMVIAGFNAAVGQKYDVMLLGPGQLTPARLRSRVDGLIISDPFYDHEPTRAVLASGVPVVAVGRTDPAMPAPAGVIQANHDDGVNALLGDMLAGGVRRPALLMPSGDYPSFWAKMVTSAYQQWCGEHDVPPLVQPLPIDAPLPDLERALEAILAARPRIDGIVAGRDDNSWIHMIKYLRQHGRPAGQDMALASLVDTPILAHLQPAVSAVNLNPPVYYRLAVEMLVSILVGDLTPPEVTHWVEVRLRPSSRLTAPAPNRRPLRLPAYSSVTASRCLHRDAVGRRWLRAEPREERRPRVGAELQRHPAPVLGVPHRDAVGRRHLYALTAVGAAEARLTPASRSFLTCRPK